MAKHAMTGTRLRLWRQGANLVFALDESDICRKIPRSHLELDALPGVLINGTVTLKPEQQDERLRWNMPHSC
jgi:hypothetical protein